MWFKSLAVLFAALALAMPSHAYRMSVWVPGWDDMGLRSMQGNAGRVNEANPVWYTVNADGSVAKMWNAENPSLRAALTGADVLPTIQNYNGGWDGALIASIVGSVDLRERHAEALTQLVVTNAYTGIDLDYESVPAAARANFTTFVQLLAQKLHSAGRQLSVTVHAKTSDSTTRRGPGSQDWAAIGAAADTVKIMGYGFSWGGSAAGPIAPLDWLDSVVGYAVSVIPAQKIIVGLPWYGYDWAGTVGQSLEYVDATALAQRVGATVGRDANGEATFSYNGRTVFYNDATSYSRKIDSILARYPQIGGFAHWRAGGEDPAIWTTVSGLSGNSTPAQPDPASFAINGPATLVARAAQPATASFALVPINGFNDTASAVVQDIDAFPGTIAITPTARIDAPAVLTVTPMLGARAGVYRLRVLLSTATITQQTVVSVTVETMPDPASFAIHGPATLVARAAQPATASFALVPINGFNDTANAVVQDIDAFPGTIAITPTARIDAPAVLTVTPMPGARAGVYRLRVLLSSATITQQTVVSVTVETSPRRRSVRR